MNGFILSKNPKIATLERTIFSLENMKVIQDLHVKFGNNAHREQAILHIKKINEQLEKTQQKLPIGHILKVYYVK